MILDQDLIQEAEKQKEIDQIVDVLVNADAIKCDPIFGPTYYYSTALYEIPHGTYVTVNFMKLATSLYDHGYRLTKGDAIKDEQEIDVHSSDT